jgi:hypothetical protein
MFHVEDFSGLLNFVARVFLLDLPQIRHQHCPHDPGSNRLVAQFRAPQGKQA